MTDTMERPAETTDPSSAAGRADAWLASFEAALVARDVERAAGMFATESFWRDLVSFTWNLTTVEHRAGVTDLLGATLEQTDPSGFAPPSRPPRTTASSRRGSPSRPLSAAAPGWCGWSARTARTGRSPSSPPSTSSRATKSRSAVGGRWEPSTVPTSTAPPGRSSARPRPRAWGRPHSPTCWSSAAVRAGIALGSRLRQLGVPALVIDKHPRPGDQWRNRYKSLCLHDPVWYDHLPYIKFPENWPVFAPKDKIGDWLESYVKVMEVPYWSNTEARSATWSEDAGEWTVEVEREGKPLTLKPTQLVFATGMSGKARMPEVPGADVFQGDVHHSSRHPGPTRTPARRRS